MKEAGIDGEERNGSLSRALAILDMFSLSTPELRLEDVEAGLGCSQATAYRYLAYLSAAGLISQIRSGTYGIGPRIIELERLAQLTDPLLIATRRVMATHQPLSENSVYRLCSLYGDKVLCIHRQGPDYIMADGARVELIRSRGAVMPLFEGAASLTILAFLPTQRIQSLYLNHAVEIARLGLGDTWAKFRVAMGEVRSEGQVITRGQFNPQLAAVAVPVRRPDRAGVLGSLTCVLPISELDSAPDMLTRVVDDLQAAGSRIAEETHQ